MSYEKIYHYHGLFNTGAYRFACVGGSNGGNKNTPVNTPGYNRPLNAEELKLKEDAEKLKKELEEINKKIEQARPELENLNKQIEKTGKDIQEANRRIQKLK